MALAHVRMKINYGRARAVVQREGRIATRRAAGRTSVRAKANLRRAGRIDTSALLRSIEVREDPSSEMGYVVEAGRGLPDARAVYQEKGTRAHGPVSSPFLVFRPKGSGALVFTKWVRGVKAARYMEDAHKAIRVADFLA